MVHLMPYPFSCRHSMMCSLCGRMWAFVQVHSSTISLAIVSACSFFYVSVPLTEPQNPSELRCACLQKARAPTVKREGCFIRFNSSSPIISVNNISFKYLKQYGACWNSKEVQLLRAMGDPMTQQFFEIQALSSNLEYPVIEEDREFLFPSGKDLLIYQKRELLLLVWRC